MAKKDLSVTMHNVMFCSILKREILGLFLFIYFLTNFNKEKIIYTYIFLFNMFRSVVIPTVLHLFFYLGESKEEKHHGKIIKRLLQNENKQSILTLVNLRAEVVVTT